MSAMSRRGALKAAGGAAGAAGLTVAAAPSAQALTPGHYQGAKLLGASGRHLVSRFSYGITPKLTRQVLNAGGGQKWFAQQLQPGKIADAEADAVWSWYPSFTYSPMKLYTNQRDGIEGGWIVMGKYQSWLMNRRIRTNRQVAEVMTEFWLNHLHVPVGHDTVFPFRVAYDGAIRRHALGRFEDLLIAGLTHPAMSIFLDNAKSTKTHPNENLGRELLELHTVGRGHYTEDDVKNAARILTGYKVDVWNTWNADYQPSAHWTGPVKVMGFSHANSAADGRPVTLALLRYLARHRATAERIARKLAVKFVKDNPSAGLIQHLANVYQNNNTNISAVLKALVAHKEFLGSAGLKVREPAEDLVATYRALRVQVYKPTVAGAAAEAMVWQADQIGATPCSWPQPDGQPATNTAWSSPARMLASIDVHWTMSGRWWPDKGLAFRKPTAWLPKASIRFDVLVDYLCQELLGRRSTAGLLQACLDAVPDKRKVQPGTTITASHPVVATDMHRLLATILDSPFHLNR